MASHLKNTLKTTFYFILFSYLFRLSNGVFSEELSEAISIKRMEKTTHLHFFFHDIHSGKSPSAMLNYEFSEGEFNGSSISVLGRNLWMDDVREMPIVGGSGRFRYASGYALAHTVWLDLNTGDAVVEYNVGFRSFRKY
ncbi:plant disease resistance response protein [Artemisia annua]|uniref:Dirigent protein n=1 Tax=Artemisia annua TaxID=35608 RepID=A0A2U1Q768_ARTAN|nr:plant disease resistance response protein [Artemisia annua]